MFTEYSGKINKKLWTAAASREEDWSITSQGEGNTYFTLYTLSLNFLSCILISNNNFKKFNDKVRLKIAY